MVMVKLNSKQSNVGLRGNAIDPTSIPTQTLQKVVTNYLCRPNVSLSF